ncbi:MAG: biotin--[acetyl-CoA-carboxylase] ligase [Phycisphaerales bacterium]|nr:MAG: biotin--[acetyl-CoA-carboxylase] ligase [Phycisphaerales bacterium]
MAEKDSLDPEKIKANVKTRRIGREVLVYRRTSSTNDLAGEYAKGKGSDGLAVFAEEQTAGRGRGGTKWRSGRADSLLCSVVLIESGLAADLLSLTCAVAVAEAIGKPARWDARIKWPNDIMINGRKVAGILLESRTYAHGKAYIIGIGINCHQGGDCFGPELRGTATSIDIEAGTFCDRLSLARRLLASLEHWLEIAVGDSAAVIERWRKLSIQLGQRVTLIYDGREFTGNCIGVDPEKGLILQLDRGGVRMFDAAHTTIAKRN